MRKIVLFMTVLAVAVLLVACGKDDVHTYQQSVTLPAEKKEQIVRLSSLSSAVSNVEAVPTWLRAVPQEYSSGAPELKLVAEANTETDERQCILTVKAASGDKVMLTVTQEAGTKEPPTGIDDLHEEPTDQPAYAPRK